jgi:hypothetical protein
MMPRTIPVALGLATTLALSLGACFDLTVPDHGGPVAMVAVEAIDRANPGDSLTLALRVIDPIGRGVPDIAITWSVLTGGGEITPGAPATDSSGLAMATWVLGMDEGSQSARAAAPGLNNVDFVVETGPPVPD